jgi:hypothetical protein
MVRETPTERDSIDDLLGTADAERRLLDELFEDGPCP